MSALSCAAVAAPWENVLDIIRLDASRFDIATSLAVVSADLLFLRLARIYSRPHVYSRGLAI